MDTYKVREVDESTFSEIKAYEPEDAVEYYASAFEWADDDEARLFCVVSPDGSEVCVRVTAHISYDIEVL